MGMDKYGVDTEKDKTANDKAVCPSCGTPLEDPEKTGIALCPTCGSKPFEKKPD